MVPTITALYSGNAVVLKVSERATEVARVIDELGRAGGLPIDLLQVVCDGPQQAREYIDAHPDFIFFTGSTANGRDVAVRAAARLVPVVLELGGKDPAIVFADCNLERTIEGVAYGAFSNAGQVCIGIKRLYIESSIFELFIDRLAERIARLRVGTGVDCDMGVLQGVGARQLFTSQVNDALNRGAKLKSEARAGLFGDYPVLLTEVPPEARLLMEETFGPIICANPFSTEADAIACANQSSFALGASVWTSDLRRAHRIAAAINSGSCAINDVIRNIGNPSAAFGGNSASGYGRYHGAQGLLAFTRTKTVMTVSASRAREINWFPFTRKTYQSLQILLELRHRSAGLLTALRRCARIALLLITTGQAMGQTTAPNAHLWLKVEIPSGGHGAVGYLVFKSSEGFPQDRKKAIVHGFSDSGPGSVAQIDVGMISPGRYAISAYLDENGNHKLDTGWLGIPKEPVGASKNPRPRKGPPRFEDCAFQMGASDQTISIRLEMPQ
jgi:4,4'-diapolycopenoate synthase